MSTALKIAMVWTSLVTNSPVDVTSDMNAIGEDFGNSSLSDSYNISIPEMDLHFDTYGVDVKNYRGPFSISSSSARYRQWNEEHFDHSWPVFQNKAEFTKEWSITKAEAEPTPTGKITEVNVYKQTISARQQWDYQACLTSKPSWWVALKTPCAWYATFLGIDAQDYFYWKKNHTGTNYTNETVLVSGGDPLIVPVIGSLEIPNTTETVRNIHIEEVEQVFDLKVTYEDTTQHTFEEHGTRMVANPVYRDESAELMSNAHLPDWEWQLGQTVNASSQGWSYEQRLDYGFAEIFEAGYVGQNVNIESAYENFHFEKLLRNVVPAVLQNTDDAVAKIIEEQNIPEQFHEIVYEAVAQSTPEVGLTYLEEGEYVEGCEVRIISDYWLNHENPAYGTICIDLTKKSIANNHTLGLFSEIFVESKSGDPVFEEQVLIASVAALVSQHPKLTAYHLVKLITGTADDDGVLQLSEAHYFGMSYGQAQ